MYLPLNTLRSLHPNSHLPLLRLFWNRNKSPKVSVQTRLWQQFLTLPEEVFLKSEMKLTSNRDFSVPDGSIKPTSAVRLRKTFFLKRMKSVPLRRKSLVIFLVDTPIKEKNSASLTLKIPFHIIPLNFRECLKIGRNKWKRTSTDSKSWKKKEIWLRQNSGFGLVFLLYSLLLLSFRL